MIDTLQNYLHLADEVALYCWCEWNKSIVEELKLFSQDAVKNDILSNTDCFVCISGGELQGFICVGKCDFPSRYQHLTPWIQNFYVLPQHRNQGVGSKLFKHAIDYCNNIRINTVYLWTYEEHLSFYQKRGFSVLSISKMSDGARFVMMCSLQCVSDTRNLRSDKN